MMSGSGGDGRVGGCGVNYVGSATVSLGESINAELATGIRITNRPLFLPHTDRASRGANPKTRL